MYHLTQQELLTVSGGCEACHDVTLQLLDACSLQQLGMINAVFKAVILNPDLQGASADTIKTALITAIENTSF